MKKINVFVSLLITLNLSACGFMVDFFPDKEYDYQLTSEIAELKVPADIGHYSSKTVPVIPVVVSPTQVEVVENNDSDVTEEPIEFFIELINNPDMAPVIHIGDTLERSWRLVGKALSRNAFEVTERNEQEHIYSLQYDPDFEPIEDGGLWNEIVFIFTSDPAVEQEYKIKLIKKERLIEVFVLENKDQPLPDGVSLKLLNLVYKTIKDDLDTTH